MQTGNRVLIWLALSAAFWTLGTERALAQRGRGFGFGPNRAQLATLKEVQEELSLTDEQKSAARDATKAFSHEVKKLVRQSAGDVEKVRAGMPDLHANATAAINDKLTPPQKDRLTQIFIQQNGVNSVFDPQVRAALLLTDEQLKTLRTARAKNREEGLKAAREAPQGETRAERADRFAKLFEEAESRILKILTLQQKTAFEKMRGEELEVNLLPLFPPPPPPANSSTMF